MALTTSKTIYSEGSGPLMVRQVYRRFCASDLLSQAIGLRYPVPVLASAVPIPISARRRDRQKSALSPRPPSFPADQPQGGGCDCD